MADNKYRYLNCLSMERLETMLRLAVNAESDEEDEEYVNAILEVMEKKESEHPTGRLSDVNKAWEDFQKYYNTGEGIGESLYFSEEEYQSQSPLVRDTASGPRGNKRRSYRAILAAAIAAALVITIMIPTAFGYPNLIQMIGKWTAEQFYLRTTGDQMNAHGGVSLRDAPEEYAGLADALRKHGIDRLYIPRTIPDGFVAGEPELYVLSDGNIIDFRADYENGEDRISVDVIMLNEDKPAIHEKDDREVEIYYCGGNEHYIFYNLDLAVAVWYKNGLEYSIATTLPVSEMKTMIDSIYEE